MVNEKKIKVNIVNIFFLLCLLAMALYAVIGGAIRGTDYQDDYDSSIYSSDFEWSYLGKDGVWKEAEMPFSPMNRAGELATVRTMLPDNLQDNMILTLRPDQLDMMVEIDGLKRAYYSTEKTRFIGKVSCRRYIFMPVSASDSGKEMVVRLTTTADNMGRFETRSYGPKSEVLVSMIREDIVDIVLAVVMLIISIMCLIFGMVLKIGFKTNVELNYLSLMSILASIWILCNAEMSQIYFTNGSIASNIDYMCLMLLPFPFLLYVEAVQSGRYAIIFKIFEYISLVEVVVCMSLALAKVYDLSQLYVVVAINLGSTLIMIVITSYLDIVKYKNRNHVIIAVGILAAIVSAIVQITLYFLGNYAIGGKSVGIALLILLATAICDTFVKVREIALEKQVAIAERAAESHFLASMSHEIRTPINAVLGMNEMILRECKDKEIKSYSENIERSGNMLLSLVNDILDFSKINSGKMDIIKQEYSLTQLVSDVESMLSLRATDKKLRFEVKIKEGSFNDLYGDEVRLKQIMVNLITNAIKYTDEGSVTLSVLTETFEEDNISLRIDVTDTGRGIKEEEQDRLFDAFSRADEKKNRNIEGTGLGLALVKQITSSMDGTVGVKSVYGEGSTFTVIVPQEKTSDKKCEDVSLKKSENNVSSKTSNEARFTAEGAKVLVVDDNSMNLTVMKGLLKRTLVSLDTASSGGEAIELLKEKSYDLILMDHLMPVMDGEETLKVIKDEKLAPGTPIIVLTANAVAGAREHYIEVGFDEYMSKPVRAPELEMMLKRYLANLDLKHTK